MDIYNQTDAISKTGLDKIDSSPLDYWWHFLRPDREPYVPDEKKIFDDALRCAVFTPNVFSTKYSKMPVFGRKTEQVKSEIASLNRVAASKNQILLPFDKFDLIKQMQAAVNKHEIAVALTGSGSIGMPNRFEEQNTGAIVKFLPHWIHSSGIIVNLMSTKDATPDAFSREAWNMRLDKKAALQIDGVGNGQGFVFINIEIAAPFKIGIHYLGERSMMLGRDTYIRNCETYVKCLESGQWPGLPKTITAAELPNWAFKS